MTLKQQISLVRRTQTDLYKEAGRATSEIAKTTITEQATALNYVLESLNRLAQLQAIVKELLTDELNGGTK